MHKDAGTPDPLMDAAWCTVGTAQRVDGPFDVSELHNRVPASP